jgi:cytochrome c nitrite reductase small subunit
VRPKRNPGVAVAAAVLAGVLAGVSIYTFWYGKGYSYLSDDPLVCANCHIMRASLDGWNTSSHRLVVCNDCHLPHHTIPKYVAKGENGIRHSAAFTFLEVQVLRATSKTVRNINANCIRCHREIVSAMLETVQSEPLLCTHCHRRVGHRF